MWYILHIHTDLHNHHIYEYCLDTYNKLIWFTVADTVWCCVFTRINITRSEQIINAFEKKGKMATVENITMQTKDINKVEPSLAKQSRQRVRSRHNSLCFGNKGSYLSGDHLGGCQSGQGGDVPEGDSDLLGESLGDEGVPGDGGGDEGEGGHQSGQVRKLVISCSQPSSGQCPGGEDVVSGGGETHSLYQSSEGLLGSKEKSDDACLHQWLSDQDWGALSDNLA